MMSKQIFIFGLSFLLSFILSIILTKISLKILTNLGIVDKPSERRKHNFITPRGAGIVLIFILWILFPLMEYLSFGIVEFSLKLLLITIPLCTVSLLDDIYDLSAILRFIIQSVCALFAIIFIIDVKLAWYNYNFLSEYFIIFLLYIILVGFTNIYNFLDGIDGMTAIESIHLSIIMLLLCTININIIPNAYLIIIVSTLILGWSLGFLTFNWPPAKIFLGDIGSIVLGFIIAIFMITIASVNINLFLSSFIAILYYVVDGGGTIIIRIINRERVWEPHLNHFFQKANRRGMSNKMILMHIIVCNFFLTLLSLSAMQYPILSSICACVVVFITIKKFISYETVKITY